jgi:transposase
MIPMLTRHAIQVLRSAGHTEKEIAELTGVSEREVRRIEAEPAVTETGDAGQAKKRGVGRPSKVVDFERQIQALLEEEPTIRTVEVLRRLRGDGYDGGKSAVYELVRSLRPADTRLMMRFEGLPGEFSQHDFGEVKIAFLNGEHETIRFFASRLKYSRWVAVTIVADQRVERLVRTMVEHFKQMGGVPLLAVFDRPKTVALAWRKDGVVTEWNPTFAAVTTELGIGVELCWPHAPQQKGSVENLVGWVKGSFFKQRRFWDRHDLETQLAEWLREVNDERPSRATGIIPEIRRQEELKRLRPLKIDPSELALRYPVTVGPTGMVQFDGAAYSMPAEAVSVSGTLFLYPERVRIVAGRHQVEHPRLHSGQRSVLSEHRSSAVAAVSGKRAKRYLKREHLLELGPAAHEFLTELVHRRPRLWIADVDRLHDLLQHHGESRMLAALQAAVRQKVYGAEYVATILHDADIGEAS